MNIGLSHHPAYSRHQETLKISKGSQIIQPSPAKGTPEEALKFLDAQNKTLDKERMVELTYGPKRSDIRSFVPDYVKLDNKVLHFEGVIRDNIQDWWTEKNRVHFVKVLYYLENDTMKVMEPLVPNSGLYQGTLLIRGNYLHPNKTRNYHWKDLNVGNDIDIYGRFIHLYDCDLWTRAYLTEQGIEVNEPELRPENPILLERKAMEARGELRNETIHDINPSSQFFAYDGKVLRFYGIFKNDKESPMGIRRVVLNFYLSDGSLEIVENWPPNSGRGPMMPHGREVNDNIPCNIGRGSWMTIIKRQRVLVDRKKDVEKIPCYFDPRDEDDVIWISPSHLRTGEDVNILGKTFFLNKCNEFTTQFYKMHYGLDMQQIEVVKKPNIYTPMLVPPHEFGLWEEGLQDCFKPHAKAKPKVHQMPLKPKELYFTTLRFSAFMDTPRETEQGRVFIISYFMEDDTVKVHEQRMENSGHSGGLFFARGRLRKDLGKTAELTPSLAKGAKPVYYEASDFYIGAKIVAGGSTFVIKDADLAVFKFMEKHPEIYPDVSAKEQKELADFLKGYTKPSYSERMLLLQELKEQVMLYTGTSVFPYPSTLNLGSDYRPRSIVDEELYSANPPISKTSLKKLLDAFTFKGKTDVNEVKAFLNVALGHDRCH